MQMQYVGANRQIMLNLMSQMLQRFKAQPSHLPTLWILDQVQTPLTWHTTCRSGRFFVYIGRARHASGLAGC